MSEEPNDGGPAFPVVAESSHAHDAAFRGMSLRDYFAGQSLPGITSLSRFSREENKTAAKWAYEIADAMIQEREKRGAK